MNPDELRRRGIGGDGGGSTEGSAGGEGPKRQDQVVKFSSGARGQFPSGSAETGGEMKKFASRNRTPVKSFNQFTGQSPKGSAMNPAIGGIDFDNEVTAKEINPKPKKQKPTITRSRKRVDRGFDSPPPLPTPPPKKPVEEPKTTVGKALKKAKDFAKKEPVAALATYDLGKGVLGKILKVKSFAPGVVGGTVGRRSARGGGGL